MRKALLLLILFIPTPLQAWDEEDHKLMSKIALEEVASDWGLNVPYKIHPLQRFLDKLVRWNPTLKSPWHFSDFLKINPKIDLDHQDPTIQGGKEMTPLEILQLYSADPDDGRDQDLFVRDEKGNPQYAYEDQKWFGVLQGPDSQAFRHIEKPPFRWREIRNTFGIPLKSVGEASRRSEIYFQLSLLAFALKEDYWGWRFLASSLHYLEDLHNPYHAGQINLGLLFRGIRALFLWGFKERGFMGTFSHIVSNSHRFFESYVFDPEGKDEGGKEVALALLRGKEVVPIPGSVFDLASQVRDASNHHLDSLLSSVTQVADPILLTSYRLKTEGILEDKPSQFLKKGAHFDEANRKIFTITQDRFRSSGRVIRTAVKGVIDRRDSDPAISFEKLVHLLERKPE